MASAESQNMSMHVLVTWGTKRKGTEEIARVVAEALTMRGFDVTAVEASQAPAPRGFDAVVAGGALYSNRWHHSVRRYANRHAHVLRHRPNWFFSSGPLDDSAQRGELPPIAQVKMLMERCGTLDHRTFGGRLRPDARGFVARAMAKTHAGDWRDWDAIRAWANDVADHLLSAQPGVANEPPERAIPRLVEHALVGWAACTLLLAGLLTLVSDRAALAIHTALAPIVFGMIASRYFRPGARQPLPTALVFGGTVAALDLTIVRMPVTSVLSWGLPVALIIAVTWAVGSVRAMMPLPKGPSTMRA